MSKYLDEKAKKMLIGLGIVIGIIVLVIIIILIINSFKGVSLGYVEIEDKMVDAARSYYSNRSDALPLNEKEEVEVSATTLAEDGYMKELSKYQSDKNISCNGKVIVTKSGDLYNYSPYLDCGDKYTTKYLYEKLLETIVSKDDGLYKTTQYSPEKKASDTYYVYKGDYVNNYVKINTTIWRIVKVYSNYDMMLTKNSFNSNSDSNISWDNRYNVDKKFSSGINDYYKSIIRKNLQGYYDRATDTLKQKIVLKDICVASRKKTDTKKDGSIECSKVLSTDYASLLTAYDYMNASLDDNCKKVTSNSCRNYNYLVKYDRTFWLMTANADSTYEGYYVSNGVNISNLAMYAAARPVINVTKNLIYAGGSGTEADPYLVK